MLLIRSFLLSFFVGIYLIYPSIAQELDIKSNIVWLGWQKDLEDFYSCLDIMLFNSDWDAVGLSPLEAIQRGVPTFASVINGGLEEILNGEFSFFIDSKHDVDALSNKLLKSLSDKEKVYQLTLKCRDHINLLSDPLRIANEVLSKLTFKELE